MDEIERYEARAKYEKLVSFAAEFPHAINLVCLHEIQRLKVALMPTSESDKVFAQVLADQQNFQPKLYDIYLNVEGRASELIAPAIDAKTASMMKLAVQKTWNAARLSPMPSPLLDFAISVSYEVHHYD